MNSESDRIETAKGIIKKRGRGAVEKATEEILGLGSRIEVVSSALEYFANVTFRGALPVFPALLSLSCEAEGGDSEKASSVGAALMLMAAAADVHDDIIDNSKMKYSKKTVFGRFGRSLSILVGDALLVCGLALLCRECESLRRNQSAALQSLMLEAFFEISSAEARETQLRGKLETKPEEYFEVINLKAAVPEIHCKIGAILGGADEEIVQSFGEYGRAFGVLSVVRDEFIDLEEYSELRNRIKNEILPLPALYALQDQAVRSEIKAFMENPKPTKKGAERVVELVLGSNGVQELKGKMKSTIRDGLRVVTSIQNKLIANELALLLEVTLEGL